MKIVKKNIQNFDYFNNRIEDYGKTSKKIQINNREIFEKNQGIFPEYNLVENRKNR